MTQLAYELVPEPLDYDALVADYNAGLVDRLRGFGPAANDLALWVPDEDALTGLRNLWDAAACAGMPSLSLHLGVETTARLDADTLLAMAARFGVATIRPTRRGLSIEVFDLHPAEAVVTLGRNAGPVAVVPMPSAPEAAPRERLPAVYRAAVEQAAASATHDVPVIEHEDWIVVDGNDGDVTLTLAVDPASHAILDASFAGAGDRIEVGVLESLCRIVDGLPLIEAADHAVIRLEHTLRDGAAPVPGIVTPRAAASAFDRPLALLRDALASYRAATGYAELTSSHDAGPSAAWRALDRDARHRVIGELVADFIAGHGLPADAFALVGIEFDVRLVFRAAPNLELPRLTMALERAIRDDIDERLEVYLEEIRDRNKLRRLAIVENDR
jgi:hypothetical protein